jgi:hypothetical protein
MSPSDPVGGREAERVLDRRLLRSSGSAAQDQTARLRICNNCDSLIGTARAAMKLRDCPECYQSIVPVEDRTHAVSAQVAARSPQDEDHKAP